MGKHGRRPQTKGSSRKSNHRARPPVVKNTLKISSVKPYRRDKNKIVAYLIEGKDE